MRRRLCPEPVTSIERTAYPRFGRMVTARELTGMSPSADEVAWAGDLARSDAHLLALVLSLKCFQRLGYFPRRRDVPAAVTDHLRHCLGLADGVQPEVGSERTGTSQHQLVRERVGVTFDPERARVVAGEAIRAAVEVKNNPPDLINVALEMQAKASLELPGFSTLNTMASQIRAEVNNDLFKGTVARMAPGVPAGLDGLLEVVGPSRTTPFNDLKRAAGRASWSAFRDQVAHLAWVDSLGDTGVWLAGMAETKIADFAGEAAQPTPRSWAMSLR